MVLIAPHGANKNFASQKNIYEVNDDKQVNIKLKLTELGLMVSDEAYSSSHHQIMDTLPDKPNYHFTIYLELHKGEN